MRIGGKGTPWLAHKVFPSPQAPHPSPTRFFQEDETLRRRCRFPRGNRPPGTRKKESPEASQRDNRVSNSKSPPVWRAFLLIRQSEQPKKTVSSRFMPNQQRPEDRHSRIPRSVASRRTRHKEGTTRLPILRLRVRAKRVAATKKEPATPHESEAAQRPERGRTPSGHVL